MGLEQGGWQQHSLNSDLERLASAMQAVEQACAALQVLRERPPWNAGCCEVRVRDVSESRNSVAVSEGL